MKKIVIIASFLASSGLEKIAVVGAEELSKEFDGRLIVMDLFQINYLFSGKMIDLNVSLMDRGIFKRLEIIMTEWKNLIDSCLTNEG